MKRGIALTALAGLALAIALVVFNGFAAVTRSLLDVGWGLLGISLYHLLPLTLSALGWRSVAKPVWRAHWSVFVWARAVREAATNLLPVLQVGGDLIGARVLTLHNASAGIAGASVVVDLTLEVFAQFLFTLLGLTILFAMDAGQGVGQWAAAGVIVGSLALGGFLLAQRHGLFRLLEPMLDKLARKLSLGRVENLHDTIQQLYRNPRALVKGGAWHLLSWIVSVGEVWIALDLMGHPVTMAEALALESLSHALRSAGFAIPGGLGVQEGAYVLVGAIFGLGAEFALALSLTKRVRDLVLGVPPLAGWHWSELKRFWANAHRHALNDADEK